MPGFKNIIFYQYNSNIKLFLEKKQTFQALGAPSPEPVPPAAGGFAPRPPITSGGWGLCLQTPKTPPFQLRISGYAPATLCNVYNYMRFRSFCFKHFFLDRSLSCKPYDVNYRCMLNA